MPLLMVVLGAATCLAAERQEGRMGLEGVSWQSFDSLQETERRLILALRDPLLAGRDCSRALDFWFKGRADDAKGHKDEAIAAWQKGLEHLDHLPKLAPVPKINAVGKKLTAEKMLDGLALYLLQGGAVTWTSGKTAQHGILLLPKKILRGHLLPLLIYVHDGTSGLSSNYIDWLGKQCRRGYAVFAPSLPGQPALAGGKEVAPIAALRTPGDVDDFRAAARQVLSGMDVCLRLSVVRKSGVVLIGNGRGATIALLAAVAEPRVACVVAVDAVRLNPFRLYWEHMARNDRRWTSWSAFCQREPLDQLRTMLGESVLHQAEEIRCPVLLILPEAERDTLRGTMHENLVKALNGSAKSVTLRLVDGEPRSFIRDWQQGAGRTTYRYIVRFLYAHAPPEDGLFVPTEKKCQPGGENR